MSMMDLEHEDRTEPSSTEEVAPVIQLITLHDTSGPDEAQAPSADPNDAPEPDLMDSWTRHAEDTQRAFV